MSNFKFKVAYTTDPSKVQSSLDSGIIDPGDLVVINEDGENEKGSLVFITNDNKILPLTAAVDRSQLEEVVSTYVDTELDDKVRDATAKANSWKRF